MNKQYAVSMPRLAQELEYFENYLDNSFPANSYIEKTARELITGGGKRLRPALVIASAMTGDYDRERAMPLAAAIETMHAATLVHDDVIDGAETRRDRPALHTLSGNHVAVYTGDYMLARSLRMLAACKLPAEEMTRLAIVIEQICNGDVSQYLGRSKIPGYRTYLRRILVKQACYLLQHVQAEDMSVRLTRYIRRSCGISDSDLEPHFKSGMICLILKMTTKQANLQDVTCLMES
jgi:heptaprenyl diphosphate synthase